MAGDVVLSRELKSLQQEMSASRQERAAGGAAPSAVPPPVAAEPTPEAADAGQLRDQLGELASEVTGFFEEAEKSISAHPAQSVLGAFLAGILVGRLLGRR